MMDGGRNGLLLVATALSLLLWCPSVVNAADCNTQQQREAGGPSGDDIATALTKDIQLDSVCSGNFPPGNNLLVLYVHSCQP